MKKVTLEEKMAIKNLLEKGKTFKHISEELELGFEVTRKWCRAIKKGNCLSPQIGRPPKGPLSTFSKTIIAEIDKYRPGKKGWGSDTIKVELDLNEELNWLEKPSISSISRYLKSEGRSRGRNKHVDLKIEPVVPTQRAHQNWQLDAEGNCQIENIGTVAMLNIKEIHSKVYVQNFPCQLSGPNNHATTIDYQNVLRLGMMEFGMPEGLQVDHESIYFDNVNASPFPTTFHLWLTGLGIKMHLTPKGKPYKQGSVERSHQTIQRQVIEGQTFNNWSELFKRCEQRRQRLNYHIPCRTLGKIPPLVACPQAKHSGRNYHPSLENKIFDINRIYDYLSQGIWYRSISPNKTSWIGSNPYYLSKATPKTETMIKFDKETKAFVFYDADEQIINQKTAKSLTFKELAGDLKGFCKSLKKNPHFNFSQGV